MMGELKVGQVWWARRHAGLNLFKAKITDITARTIEVEDISNPTGVYSFGNFVHTSYSRERKVKGEFDFIELIPSDYPKTIPAENQDPQPSEITSSKK